MKRAGTPGSRNPANWCSDIAANSQTQLRQYFHKSFWTAEFSLVNFLDKGSRDSIIFGFLWCYFRFKVISLKLNFSFSRIRRLVGWVCPGFSNLGLKGTVLCRRRLICLKYRGLKLNYYARVNFILDGILLNNKDTAKRRKFCFFERILCVRSSTHVIGYCGLCRRKVWLTFLCLIFYLL